MITISINGSVPSRSTPKAHELVHYVLNRARVEFVKDAENAAAVLEEAVHANFGEDLELWYTDRDGELLYPQFSDNFVIVIRDQYRVPVQ